MPPVLGWAAMTGDVGPGGDDSVPHHLPVDTAPFQRWRSTVWRTIESQSPMLPVTHGNAFDLAADLPTSLALLAACLLPSLPIG